MSAGGWADGELDLPGGRLRAREIGPDGGGDRGDGPLVVCVPGLSSNSRAFAVLGRRLAEAGRRVVALDLRGRGHSAPTAPGTYGLEAHARDVLAAGDALGADELDVVGHSMGALVGMHAVAQGEGRVRRLVLVDAAGPPEEAAMVMIRAGVERLGAPFASADAYIGMLRTLGVVDPWSAEFEEHYRYELEEHPEGGVRARTDRAAVLEDAAAIGGRDPRELWPTVTAPALLLRAARPIGEGFILSAADAERFGAEVPGARVVEIDANHFGIVMHETTADAVVDFLS